MGIFPKRLHKINKEILKDYKKALLKAGTPDQESRVREEFLGLTKDRYSKHNYQDWFYPEILEDMVSADKGFSRKEIAGKEGFIGLAKEDPEKEALRKRTLGEEYFTQVPTLTPTQQATSELVNRLIQSALEKQVETIGEPTPSSVGVQNLINLLTRQQEQGITPTGETPLSQYVQQVHAPSALYGTKGPEILGALSSLPGQAASGIGSGLSSLGSGISGLPQQAASVAGGSLGALKALLGYKQQ